MTRFVQRGDVKPRTTMTLAMPASVMVKAGWRMFWLGIWYYATLRKPSIEVGWWPDR